MSAVSQSYPNYLGGLNEQPDELKKPGQLVEALNVIPDPTIGLSRRPGFQHIPWSNRNTGEELDDIGIDPRGTFFEMELSNPFNEDYIYFGCVNPDGGVKMFDQDGQKQIMRYSRDSIQPGKRYEYNQGVLKVFDENDEEIAEHKVEPENIITKNYATNDYFTHEPTDPLKYCVTKNHIVFTNPTKIPTLAKTQSPSTEENKKYYSFVTLKILDTANYKYQFRRYYRDNSVVKFREITDISVDKLDGFSDRDYDRDTSLWLQREGPFRYKLEPNDKNADEKEDAIVEVFFRGVVQSVKSDGGDGFYNRVDYYPEETLINPGRGFRSGAIRVRLDSATNAGDTFDGKAPAFITFKVEDTTQYLGTDFDLIDPQVSDGQTIGQILSSLRAGFKSAGIDKALVVGNGIYLENSTEFSVSSEELAVADIINSQRFREEEPPIARVTSVAELPVECYPGFRVEVANSFDDKNNYYLEFVSESYTTDKDRGKEDTKADGYWEEIAKPYEAYNPMNGTLPHMITAAKETDQSEYVFIVSPIQYKVRTAGTSRSNPSIFLDRAPITAVNYYKNRLFFFSKIGTVVSTRAGELDNLFINTAVNTSLIDPLDLTANSNQRVPIHGSVVVNNGLVLFGSSEQYLLTTNADLLTSETANLTKVANYTYDPRSNPTYLGSNISFVSGGLSRFYEMTNLYDRGPVDIVERSQQIQTQFGRRFNQIVSSREQSMAIAYKQYIDSSLGGSSPNMMVYRFRQESSQESSQTSWVKWQLEDRDEDKFTVKRVAFVSMPQDNVFVVAADAGGRCYLWKMSGDSINGLPTSSESLTAIPKFTDGWRGNTPGKPFKTEIKFPTIYARSNNVSDVTANLTVHRVKFSTAAVGTYDLTIDRKGYDTYNLLIEQTPADEYSTEYPTLYGEKVETVPIFTRNKNLTLTMSTTYDAPLTLRSMTWEGDYNRPYYKSV